MSTSPSLSIIIPVYNGGTVFERCLAAVVAHAPEGAEVLVVDDGSTDGSADVARAAGVRVLHTPKRSGPGAARNVGVAEASGEIVSFIDADCEPNAETFERIVATFRDDPDLSAVFGSYDASPSGRPFISQFKNLFHHFTHQHAARDSESFWAGCGSVRRDAFLEVGGFDGVRYPHPSIEDIELGSRLSGRKYRIRLDPGITVKHHKVWTLVGMIRTDVFDRAVPWTRLMLETKRRTLDLNLDVRSRISGFLLVIAVALAAIGLLGVERWEIPAAALLMGVIVLLNVDLYLFFARRRGVAFAIATVPVHMLYYCYSMFGVALGFAMHLVSGSDRSTSSLSEPETLN